jgi:hypothetical protein
MFLHLPVVKKQGKSSLADERPAALGQSGRNLMLDETGKSRRCGTDRTGVELTTSAATLAQDGLG